jgi:hypothetical protein
MPSGYRNPPDWRGFAAAAADEMFKQERERVRQVHQVYANRTFERAWQRWLKKDPAAVRAVFVAGWNEAIATLPGLSTCNCLTCREVSSRFNSPVE